VLEPSALVRRKASHAALWTACYGVRSGAVGITLTVSASDLPGVKSWKRRGPILRRSGDGEKNTGEFYSH